MLTSYSLVVLTPSQADCYTLFNNEGFVDRKNDGTLLIHLRGMNDALIQNPIALNNFRPHYYDGNYEDRTLDYIRVGEDVFLAYVKSSVPYVKLEPLIDISLLDVVGRTEGIFSNLLFYQEGIGCIDQWLGVLNNADKIRSGKKKHTII